MNYNQTGNESDHRHSANFMPRPGARSAAPRFLQRSPMPYVRTGGNRPPFPPQHGPGNIHPRDMNLQCQQAQSQGIGQGLGQGDRQFHQHQTSGSFPSNMSLNQERYIVAQGPPRPTGPRMPFQQESFMNPGPRHLSGFEGRLPVAGQDGQVRNAGLGNTILLHHQTDAKRTNFSVAPEPLDPSGSRNRLPFHQQGCEQNTGHDIKSRESFLSDGSEQSFDRNINLHSGPSFNVQNAMHFNQQIDKSLDKGQGGPAFHFPPASIPPGIQTSSANHIMHVHPPLNVPPPHIRPPQNQDNDFHSQRLSHNFNDTQGSMQIYHEKLAAPQDFGNMAESSTEKEEDQRTSDQSWLNHFLRDKRVNSDMEKELPTPAKKGSLQQKIENPLKIWDAQKRLKKAVFLMAKLQKQISILETSKTSQDTDTWQQEETRALEIKKELQDERNYLVNEEKVQDLEVRLRKRRYKRMRLKQQRKKLYEQKQEELEEREKKHQAIDKWQEKINQEIVNKKQEEEMKATVDATLGEVKKKISEASKATELLKALLKLRKLRKDRLNRQGVHTKESSDEHFESHSKDQLDMLEKQMAIYQAEESALKNMLEEEREEEREKEKERKLQIQKQKEDSKKKLLDEMIFGPNNLQGIHDDNNPLLPYIHYYNQAEHSLDALIHIRREWDCFITPESVPGASRLPDGYVMPPSPADNVWASCIQD